MILPAVRAKRAGRADIRVPRRRELPWREGPTGAVAQRQAHFLGARGDVRLGVLDILFCECIRAPPADQKLNLLYADASGTQRGLSREVRVRLAASECQRVDHELQTGVPEAERMHLPVDDARRAVSVERDDVRYGPHSDLCQAEHQWPLCDDA